MRRDLALAAASVFLRSGPSILTIPPSALRRKIIALSVLALLGNLSLQLALFNLIPMGGLDGFKVLRYGVESVVGPMSDGAASSLSFVGTLAAFFLWMMYSVKRASRRR